MCGRNEFFSFSSSVKHLVSPSGGLDPQVGYHCLFDFEFTSSKGCHLLRFFLRNQCHNIRVNISMDYELNRVAQTLASILQDVLHLFHRNLQHLCVLHLGMKLWKQPAEFHQNQTVPLYHRDVGELRYSVRAPYSRLCLPAESAAPANSH